MMPVRINDNLSITGQPDLEAFQSFRDMGFAAIISARPDHEDTMQPDAAAERRAAEAAGLGFAHIPVTASTITEGDAQAFKAVLARAKGPVLAHCRTGARALALYALSEVMDGRLKASDIPAFGTLADMDLSFLETLLSRRATLVPQVKGIFDPRTWSVQYIVSDPETRKCAIIDPVLDFDERSGSTGTMNADAILAYIEKNGLTVEWILETHPHADHLTSSRYLNQKTGAPVAIGAHVTDVQAFWKYVYNLPGLPTDGSQWDHLFADGERFMIGSIEAVAMPSPGHTQASITYLVGDAAFVHDTLFMPDGGTARADFPGGNAGDLWRSIQSILALPANTRIFTGHDYQPGNREPRWESTPAEHRRANIHVAGHDEASFIALRQARDMTLPMPTLILPALQINIRGGEMPEPEANAQRYLKIPVNALQGSTWG